MDIKRSRTRRLTPILKETRFDPVAGLPKEISSSIWQTALFQLGALFRRAWLPSTLSKFTCFSRSLLGPLLPRDILDNSSYRLRSWLGRVIQEGGTILPLDRAILSHYCEKPYLSKILRTNQYRKPLCLVTPAFITSFFILSQDCYYRSLSIPTNRTIIRLSILLSFEGEYANRLVHRNRK